MIQQMNLKVGFWVKVKLTGGWLDRGEQGEELSQMILESNILMDDSSL